jgi:hypothetical protein
MSYRSFLIFMWCLGPTMAGVPLYLLFQNNIAGAIAIALPSALILTAIAVISKSLAGE